MRFHLPYPTFGWLLSSLFTLALLAALVALAVWAIIAMRRTPPATTPTPQPHQAPMDAAILEARMRYARGELTREQFLEISSDLQGTPPPRPSQ